MDVISTVKLENLICQATQGLYSDVDSKKKTSICRSCIAVSPSTWLLKFLSRWKKAVSIPEEALMSDARWEMVRST